MSLQYLQEVSFLSPFCGSPSSEIMGFQFLSAPLDQQQQYQYGGNYSEEEELDHTVQMSSSAAVKPHKICSRGHWRPVEDTKLKELVSQYGPQNWNFIAEKLQGRSGKSCRLRWFNQLDPSINRKAFSEEEEERLLAAHGMYGNKWALIARLFPGRTDNAVKNHWHVIMARRQREQSSIYKKRKLSCAQPLYKTVEITTYPNNACREATRDDSDSTCTDLSLTSSSTRGHPCLITSNISQLYQQQTYMIQMGYCNDFHDSGSRGMNQSDVSANSEVSATNSQAIDKRNINTSGNSTSQISVRFIDFLGVGDT